MEEPTTEQRSAVRAAMLLLVLGCLSSAWPSWYGPGVLRLPGEMALFATSGFLLAPSRRRLGLAAAIIAASILALSLAIVVIGAPLFIAWIRDTTGPVEVIAPSRLDFARSGFFSGLEGATWALVWLFGGAGLKVLKLRRARPTSAST